MYRERGLLASNAMFQCKSPVYPRIDTWAVRCNNIVECHGGEDEKHCQEELVNVKLVGSFGQSFTSLMLIGLNTFFWLANDEKTQFW